MCNGKGRDLTIEWAPCTNCFTTGEIETDFDLEEALIDIFKSSERMHFQYDRF